MRRGSASITGGLLRPQELQSADESGARAAPRGVRLTGGAFDGIPLASLGYFRTREDVSMSRSPCGSHRKHTVHGKKGMHRTEFDFVAQVRGDKDS